MNSYNFMAASQHSPVGTAQAIHLQEKMRFKHTKINQKSTHIYTYMLMPT